MRDDIMRLADEIQKACEDAVRNGFDIMVYEASAWEGELRALARTDHVEDKLGMVPAGWRIQLTGDSLGTIGINAPEPRPGESQRVSGMVGPWCEDDLGVLMFKYFSHVLAASPAPDHSAGVVGEVVKIGDDESGQPRILIHTTRDAIKAHSGSLLFKAVTVSAAIANPVSVGTIGHVTRDKSALTSALMRAGQVEAQCSMVVPDVLRIPRSSSLDPIIVYFEDSAPGKGRITIACYGDAWTGAWGAMGNRTVRQFVAGCDPGYLSGSLLELRKASEHFRKYTERVSAAVIDALAQQAKDQDAAT